MVAIVVVVVVAVAVAAVNSGRRSGMEASKDVKAEPL